MGCYIQEVLIISGLLHSGDGTNSGIVLIVLLYSGGVTTFKGMVLIRGLLHSGGVI